MRLVYGCILEIPIIEPHPITTEDYKKVSDPFIKEVIDTGIKVA